MKEEDKIAVKEPVSLYGSNYTYTDYLKFDFEEMVEVIRGKIFRMSPAPSPDHQRIAGNLHFEIRKVFQGKSCELFIAPIDVILPVENKKRNRSNTVVQPDLCIICNPTKIESAGCFGAPDLVVEILSPHTSKKDLENKYSVYEEAGVSEYWTIYPGEEVVLIYSLENKRYQKFKVFGKEDELHSALFSDLKIKLIDVFPSSKN